MENDNQLEQEGAPILLRVVNPTNRTASQQVYIGSPARITSDEAEGANLGFDYDPNIQIPFTTVSPGQGPADGELTVGIPIAERLVAVRKSKTTVTIRGRVKLGAPWVGNVGLPVNPPLDNVIVAWGYAGTENPASFNPTSTGATSIYTGFLSGWHRVGYSGEVPITWTWADPADINQGMNFEFTLTGQDRIIDLRIHSYCHAPALFPAVHITPGATIDLGPINLAIDSRWDCGCGDSVMAAGLLQNPAIPGTGGYEYIKFHGATSLGECDLIRTPTGLTRPDYVFRGSFRFAQGADNWVTYIDLSCQFPSNVTAGYGDVYCSIYGGRVVIDNGAPITNYDPPQEHLKLFYLDQFGHNNGFVNDFVAQDRVNIMPNGDQGVKRPVLMTGAVQNVQITQNALSRDAAGNNVPTVAVNPFGGNINTTITQQWMGYPGQVKWTTWHP